MNIMFLLIGVSFFAALIFLTLFVWAVKHGQYDDTYTPSVRVLFDDDLPANFENEPAIQSEDKPITGELNKLK